LSALAEALVPGLLLNALYATLLAAGALGAGRLLRGRCPRLQLGLWTLVVMRLVLPTDLSAPWSLAALLSPAATPSTMTPLGDGGASSVGSAPAGDLTSAARPTPGALALLTIVWAVGATVTTGLLFGRRRRLRDHARNAEAIDDPRLLAQIERGRRALGVNRPVRLVASDVTGAPYTMGLLRPVIHLPRAVAAHLDRRLAEAAIAHEMAHVARLDDLWLQIANVAKCIHFFNPIAWLSTRRLSELREMLTDERVLASAIVPERAYAASLLAVLRLDLDPVPAPSLGAEARSLSMRLHRILSPRSKPRPFTSAIATLALGALLLPLAPEPGLADDHTFAVPWVEPVPGARVTSAFGHRTHPIGAVAEHHDGTDLATPSGRPVLAATDGIVRIATTHLESLATAGTVIELDHGGGLTTFYAHLGALEVAEGTRVLAGETIGRVGSTGVSTGPHVHFEIREVGVAVDPTRWYPGWAGTTAPH